MNNTLALIRGKLGHGRIKPFIEKDLNVRYRTFVYQAKHGLIPYKTIILIMEKLNIKFEDFQNHQFVDPPKDKAQKKVDRAIKALHIPKPEKLSTLFGK